MRICLEDSIRHTTGDLDRKAPVFVTRGTQISAKLGAIQKDKIYGAKTLMSSGLKDGNKCSSVGITHYFLEA